MLDGNGGNGGICIFWDSFGPGCGWCEKKEDCVYGT